MANGFVTQPDTTDTASFDPGFVQAPPPPAEGTQTFGTSTPSATQTFGISPVATGPSSGSLAPLGPGRSAASTVGDISTRRSDSGFDDLGGVAAGVAGAGGLAALLGSQGREANGGLGGILSPQNILSGAQKLFKLGDFSGEDILENFSKEAQKFIKEFIMLVMVNL